MFSLSKLLACLVVGVSIVCHGTLNDAYAQQVRTLAGEIRLDVGVAVADLAVDVTVNNHSFVVVPPSFTIIRPITSRQTRRVTLRQGEDSALYFVDNILTNPVDYTVEFRCVGCRDTFRTQYYSEGGNRFGFANSVYLDPPSLGPVLNTTIITDATIAGEISLAGGALAARDLVYEIVIASSLNSDIVYAREPNIRLLEGESVVSYEVTGLRRAIGANLFSVSVRCTNCFGESAKAQTFPEGLSPNENHQGISFLVDDEAPAEVGPVIVAPIVDLLLNQTP